MPAEIRRVHVGNTAVTRCAHDYKVDKCCNDHEINAMTKNGIGEIDLRIGCRQPIESFQMAMPKPDAETEPKLAAKGKPMSDAEAEPKPETKTEPKPRRDVGAPRARPRAL